MSWINAHDDMSSTLVSWLMEASPRKVLGALDEALDIHASAIKDQWDENNRPYDVEERLDAINVLRSKLRRLWGDADFSAYIKPQEKSLARP